MSKPWCLVLAAGALAGCISAPEAEPATSSTSANVCESLCGDNGALIDGVPFYGAYLQGAGPQLYGTQPHVVRFARSFNEMTMGHYAPLDVDGGRLRTRAAGNWLYGPTNLTNGVMEIAVGSEKYFVRIAKVNSGIVAGMDLGEPLWTIVDTRRVETYQLQWAASDAPVNANGEPAFEDVCPHVELDHELWQNQIDASVFEGEKYNLKTSNISFTPTNDHIAWFNVACAGSLPSKMYLTMRTTASSLPPTYTTTIGNDRQAMVRAWGAQYCGGGISFTVTGHKLLIQDHLPLQGEKGWLPRVPPIGFSDTDLKNKKVTIEAVWDANGAVCLDTPRLAVEDPNVPPDPKIEQKILEKCGKRPDRCSDQPWFPDHWTEHGAFLTATAN
jgi:hypothetical protein